MRALSSHGWGGWNRLAAFSSSDRRETGLSGELDMREGASRPGRSLEGPSVESEWRRKEWLSSRHEVILGG